MISSPLPSVPPTSFGQRLAASATFDALFREGMALVEETAAYLDSAGREDARALPRLAALAYASESMRLTTRLMQIASWLLLQRAVNEGEMTPADAAGDKQRSRTAWDLTVAAPLRDTGLPQTLVTLVETSLNLQERVQRLDTAISDLATGADAHPLEAQFARIRDAFSA